MKTKRKKETGQPENDNLIVFRAQRKDLELKLREQHQAIVKEVSIPTAIDLAGLNKPEPECRDSEIYTSVITAQYKTMMLEPKTELLAEIEELHIAIEASEAKAEIKSLEKELHELSNEHRLKERELKKQDNSLLKKEQRFKNTRPFLLLMVVIDMCISSLALESMGYNKVVSYVVGLGIGCGIYYLAENIHNIISFGKTKAQQRAIVIGLFALLAVVFYVLGIFRSLRFGAGGDVLAQGGRPVYFMCLNLFMVSVVSLVCYVTKLTKQERQILDKWKLIKETVDQLAQKIFEIKATILKIRKEQQLNELSRKQILLYAQDIQRLIQQLFEESYTAFKSHNLIHRSDNQVPMFFKEPAPKLPVFYNDFKL